MRMKQYAALFALFAAFAMSIVAAHFFKVEKGAVVLWNETKSAQKINRLLTEDVANGQERAISEDYAISTIGYAEEMETLDDANLPTDFRRAWRDHKRAWRIQSNLLFNAGNYRSDDKFQRAWTKNNNEISRTWLRVLKIAEQHNAEIPAGARD